MRRPAALAKEELLLIDARRGLPGALIRNYPRTFVCRDQRLRIDNGATAWTAAYDTGAEIVVPLKNGEGLMPHSEYAVDPLTGPTPPTDWASSPRC